MATTGKKAKNSKPDRGSIRVSRLIMGRHGRVVIPVDMRQFMNIAEGDELVASLDAQGKLTLQAPDAAEHELWAMFSDVKRSLADELLKERRAEALREKES